MEARAVGIERDDLRYILHCRLLCIVSQAVAGRHRNRMRQGMTNGANTPIAVFVVRMKVG